MMKNLLPQNPFKRRGFDLLGVLGALVAIKFLKLSPDNGTQSDTHHNHNTFAHQQSLSSDQTHRDVQPQESTQQIGIPQCKTRNRYSYLE